MTTRLDRFHRRAEEGWPELALRELSSGRKQSHWIWWVFPQLEGLGGSPISNRYALEDDDEARAFLDDSLLRSNLVAVTAAVRTQVDEGTPLAVLLGSAVDVRKLVSSLTLFGEICVPDRPEEAQLAADCRRILAAAAAQGVPPCATTLNALGL